MRITTGPRTLYSWSEIVEILYLESKESIGMPRRFVMSLEPIPPSKLCTIPKWSLHDHITTLVAQRVEDMVGFSPLPFIEKSKPWRFSITFRQQRVQVLAPISP